MNRQVMFLAALAGILVYFLFGDSNVDHGDSEASLGGGGGSGGGEPRGPAESDCRVVIPPVDSDSSATA